MRLIQLLKEYGGYDRERTIPDTAWEASRGDAKSKVAIYDPKTSSFLADYEHKSSHSQLIMKLRRELCKNPETVDHSYRLENETARAYWVPDSGELYLYQMTTPSNMLVDPPDEIVRTMIDKLGISRDLIRIAVID